ncbi:transposase family protein [Streptomyces zaomyceticus]|uniref:transposase family protein n=1 Tax=Streptomyces zaomyceticus TaxID=68286 RepID=UPI002E0DD88F|nr:transposase family protein [Streptomyces zaomyceticus]
MARGRAGGAACPGCGRFSDRVHDRHQRRLRDLPLADQGFVIRLTVRRFICGFADCRRRTFAEPFSRLTVPHARFTTAVPRIHSVHNFRMRSNRMHSGVGDQSIRISSSSPTSPRSASTPVRLRAVPQVRPCRD